MSQPIDTQDCVDPEPPSTSATQLTFESGSDDKNSVFVQLRRSPRKGQMINTPIAEVAPTSQAAPTDAAAPTSVTAPTGAISQSLFDSQVDEEEEEAHPQEARDSHRESPVIVRPPKKRSRLAIETQEGGDDTKEQEETAKLKIPKKTEVLKDGTVISYHEKHSSLVIRYFDETGKVIHTKYEELSSFSSTQSSGYMADHFSGTSSSGTSSHNSQDLILKSHRSAEDHLFSSPPIPVLRENRSAPPERKPNSNELPPLPKNVNKVIVSQQRQSILNRTKQRRESLNDFRQRHISGLAGDSSVPNISDISEITAGTPQDTQDAAGADTEPPSQTQDHSNAVNKELHASFISKKSSPRKKVVRKRKRKPSVSLTYIAPIEGRSSRSRPPAPCNELMNGARVVARWKAESHYYLGVVVQRGRGLDRFQVMFDDEYLDTISRCDMLVADYIPCTSRVHAKKENSETYHPAVVQEVVDHQTYKVKFTDGESPVQDCRVSSRNICLDASQFRDLGKLLTGRFSSSDDTSSGKERFLSGVNNPVPSTSGIKTSTPSKAISGLPMETYVKNREKIYTDVQRSPVKHRTEKQSVSPAASRNLTFGMLNVFGGFVFLMTSLKKDKFKMSVMDKRCIGTDGESESQGADASAVDVDFDTISMQIEELGGVYIEKFDADVVSNAKKAFLVSSAFGRTVKYLQCLAANISPVSYLWVEQCYKQKEYVDEKCYLLPAGIDIRGEVVEWRMGKMDKPLSEVSIYIAAKSNSRFFEDWKSILEISGAFVVKKISVNSGIMPNYILSSGEGCSKQLINQANRLKIEVVSPEWAIQSLITGTRSEPCDHASFRGKLQP